MICTYFLHLGFELGEVVALGDTEVPVGELVLVDAVRRVCHADGQYCRGAIGTLSLMDVTQDGVRMGTWSHGSWIARSRSVTRTKSYAMVLHMRRCSLITQLKVEA